MTAVDWRHFIPDPHAERATRHVAIFGMRDGHKIEFKYCAGYRTAHLLYGKAACRPPSRTRIYRNIERRG